MSDTLTSAASDAPIVVPDQSLSPGEQIEAIEAATGEVAVLAVTTWRISEFISGIEGWLPITPEGTAGPAATVDQVIAAGESSGVTLERR
jgi:hypothetical protein